MPDGAVMQIFDEHRRRILTAIPEAEVALSGSALLEDVVADDIDLVALIDDVGDAAQRLRGLYVPLYEEEWRDDWAAFRTRDSPQIDVVLTRSGTKGDAHHRKAWDLVARDAQLLADYRALKASRENYAERKAAFFDRVVALLPER